ncbi:MAG TPA: DUF6585 family protein [Ktedonobacterales bacterium]|jgi:hypothetical protein
MTLSSSRQQAANDADTLGARRYEYRYPLSAKLIAFAILVFIPLATTGFLTQSFASAGLADRVVPGLMALIVIGAGVFLVYRQAYFAWSVITVYEQGLRFDFWRKHLVIPWSRLGKFYLGPGRAPKWHITDKDENILCELKTNAVGRAFTEGSAEPAQTAAPAPIITDAIIEQGNMTLYETPFQFYAPAPRCSRRNKKSR